MAIFIVICTLLNLILNVSGSLDFQMDFFREITAKMSAVMRNSNDFNDTVCNLQYQYIFERFSNSSAQLEPWIISIFDSWGKMPAGVTYGNIIDLGNYDQCLDVTNSASLSSKEIGVVNGQYCLLPMSFDLRGLLNIGTLNQSPQTKGLFFGGGPNALENGNFVLMDGICVPASCDPNYIFGVIAQALNPVNITLVPMDPETLCVNSRPTNMSALDIVTIIIFVIITGLMIASTAYDVYKTKFDGENVSDQMWCRSFSIMTNGKKLFACRNSKSPDVVNCLNGIRVISLFWVMLAHAYTFSLISAVVNFMSLLKWIEHFFAMVVVDGTVSVDTFFVISGFLVTWNIFKELRRNNGSINIPLMYFHRYLRILPPLVMAILFQLTFVNKFGDGPFSGLMSSMIDGCEKWWYTSLLFVQNYVNPNEMVLEREDRAHIKCLGHTWYLQVDMQLFILSPILIIPLYKWGKKVIPVGCTLILLAVGCSFATFYVNKMKLGILSGGDNFMGTNMAKIYFPTHIRMASWLVGVPLAYLLYTIKGKKYKLPIWAQVVGWIVSLGTMAAVVFGPYNINQTGYDENLVESSSYTAFSRVSWCLAVAWVIFACATGHGYFVNSFLSMKIWLPFARLSYSMYLLSYILQSYRAQKARVGIYFSDYYMLYTFWGDLILTLIISIYWVLAFEYPVGTLETYLLRHRRPKVQDEKPVIAEVAPPVVE